MSELPKVGDIIDAKYRIDHRIGSGAMSVVYQVTHTLTQKRFALKWLLPELALEPDFAARFLREAKVAGRVEHPNIVKVYDLGNPDDAFYMVLELLSGESLHQRIMRADELSWTDACRLLLPCMRAVAEAHRHGIVHRDLKPANIFVCSAPKNEPERTKVLDFGLAKLARAPGEFTLSGTTRSGVVMGTPNYMPLEQMRGEPIDHRVDVFALGVTLYQTLSGRLPFAADSLSDLILLLASQQPTPLERWAPRVPQGVSAVVTKALARDRHERYASVDAMLDALAPFVPPGLLPERRASQRGTAQIASDAPKLASAEPRESERDTLTRRRWLRPAILVGTIAATLGAVYGAREYQRVRDEANAADTLHPGAPPFGPAPAPLGIEAPEPSVAEDVAVEPEPVEAESSRPRQIQLETLEVHAQFAQPQKPTPAEPQPSAKSADAPPQDSAPRPSDTPQSAPQPAPQKQSTRLRPMRGDEF